jgi:organic radical activating enzyme
MKLERHTTSFCTTCYREIPAVISVHPGAVLMHKTCAVHGTTAAEVERDPVFYTHVMGLKSPNIYSGYFVDVTRKCNLRCTYCYYDLETKDPEGEFSIPRIVEECRVAATTYGEAALPFILTGGEPTLRDDLPELIMALQKVGPVVMLSNGVRLSKDDDLRGEVLMLLEDKERVCHLNLSIHDDQTDAWKTLLQQCREEYRKVESALIVVDSAASFLRAIDFGFEYSDVVQSFRIKAASKLWNEQKPDKKIFVSDMLAWLEGSGRQYQIIMPGHNKPSFVNVLVNGLWFMLVSWYDVSNVDIKDINCAPYYRARNGEVVNLVTYALINEGMQRGWCKGQRISMPETNGTGPLQLTSHRQNRGLTPAGLEPANNLAEPLAPASVLS